MVEKKLTKAEIYRIEEGIQGTKYTLEQAKTFLKNINYNWVTFDRFVEEMRKSKNNKEPSTVFEPKPKLSIIDKIKPELDIVTTTLLENAIKLTVRYLGNEINTEIFEDNIKNIKVNTVEQLLMIIKSKEL